MATKIEVLSEMAQAIWLDMSVDDCVQYAHEVGLADDDAGTVNLTAAEEHFVEAWVEREWGAQDD